MTKTIATFKVFWSLHIWVWKNGRKMEEVNENGEI